MEKRRQTLDVRLPDARAFYGVILAYALEALKFNQLTDNFDADRYNIDGLDHANDFDVAKRARYFDWFMRTHERLFAAYSMLADETSRRLYLHLIAFKLAGHLSVRLPVTYPDRPEDHERYEKTATWTPSKLPASKTRRQLRHYDFTMDGRHYVIDCTGLEYYLLRGQYFFARDGVSIAPAAGDHVIDAGALMGETALVFSNAVGPSGHVWSFDPVADHLEMLDHNIAQFPIRNVTSMPFGVSDRDVAGPPIVLNRFAAGFQSQHHMVPLRRIDGLVEDGTISRIDFLKLDVEGAELAALRGAQQSIARFRPKLAVSLYHQPQDFYAIILFIKQHFPFYACHIDHYTIHGEETVLYCRATE